MYSSLSLTPPLTLLLQTAMEKLKGEEGLKTDLGIDYARIEAEYESTKYAYVKTNTLHTHTLLCFLRLFWNLC